MCREIQPEGLKYCLRLNSHIVVSASRHIVTVREHARMNIGYVLFLAVAMVAAGMILTMYLSLQSDITNSIKNISRQEKILNDLRLDNDENYSRITSSINLDEVKRIAIQELGMGYAQEGQIITFNGESSDYVRQTGEIPN